MIFMLDAKIEKTFKSNIVKAFVIFLSFILVLSLAVSFYSKHSYASGNIRVLAEESDNNQANSTQDTESAQPQNGEVNLSDFESTVVYLINTTRVSNGLNALTPNQMLTDISRSRSSDMLNRNYFAHYTPEGKNILKILRENGIKYSKAGENLAQSMPADFGTPDAFMNAWMNSPSHAANILRQGYGIIGVGVSDNGGRRVLTTVFKN
ncbi:MAG: CAP domain-containing protein [Actinobacteria bacterium]|nr:CAP domain-containing protein [Actinomycetota bacterium]